MTETAKKKLMIYFLGDEEKTSIHIMSHLARPEVDIDFIKDPRVYIQTIQNNPQATVVLDLDMKDDRIPKAILKFVRTNFGKNMLVFGITALSGSELLDYMRANGITDILSKKTDKESVDKKMIGRIMKLYGEKKRRENIQKAEIPKIVDWFFEKVSPNLAMVSTALETIDEPETKLKYYADKLELHGPNIIKMVKSLSKSAEDPHFIQALRLYGFDNIRNLLVMFTLAEALKFESVGWNEKTGMLSVEPKVFVQYAVKGYSMFIDEGRYKHIAFVCGLLFDYLHHLNESSQTKDANIKKQIETRFGDALINAKKCYKRAKGTTDLAYERHILTHLMMVEAGKIMMMFFFKDYPEFLAKAEKKALSAALLNLAEIKKYNITHGLMGSLAAQMMTGLEESAHSVLFSCHPILLQGDEIDHDSFTLSNFCHANA